MRPLLRDRLIVGILIFVALCLPDFGLSRGFTQFFCPHPSQICAICVKGALFRFSRIETRLIHVSRPKVLAHYDCLSKLHQVCDMHYLNNQDAANTVAYVTTY